MSWEVSILVVAVVAAGAAIVSIIYGEIQRRSAQEQLRLAQEQLRLAREQAEARPHIEVGWAPPKIKYKPYLAGHATLRLQVKNTGKVAARGVCLALYFDQAHLVPLSDSRWTLRTLYPTPPTKPITKEVDVSITAPGFTIVHYSVISEESSIEGDLKIADLGRQHHPIGL